MESFFFFIQLKIRKRGLCENILFHLHFLLETWTFKIVENPAIVEKIQLLKLSAIAGFYCTLLLLYKLCNLSFWYCNTRSIFYKKQYKR